jgi:hypothetical protein
MTPQARVYHLLGEIMDGGSSMEARGHHRICHGTGLDLCVDYRNRTRILMFSLFGPRP